MFILGYSISVYLFFLVIFNYLVIFVGGSFLQDWLPLPVALKTVDEGAALFGFSAVPDLLVNLCLLIFSTHLI